LLISSSRLHGSGFLEFCRDEIAIHFRGIREVLFVPYALADREGYEKLVAKAFEPTGIQIRSLHRADKPVAAVQDARGIFIGGGNTFRLLKSLYDLNLVQPIRSAVLAGVPYMGSSAGTNMACPTIKTTNDMPIVQPPSFEALQLIPFQINPHYLDADPNSTHKGETREQRLREYLEENSVPVVGLREGSWLKVSGNQCQLGGQQNMILFRQGQGTAEFAPGSDLSFLL
jgi:dipeptidase E